MTDDDVSRAAPGHPFRLGAGLHSGLQSWTGAAANLFLEQEFVNRLGQEEAELAVVAWIGDDTPAMPISTEVLEIDKAEAGAVNLRGFFGRYDGRKRVEAGRKLVHCGPLVWNNYSSALR